jgi:hypothetical protein
MRALPDRSTAFLDLAGIGRDDLAARLAALAPRAPSLSRLTCR